MQIGAINSVNFKGAQKTNEPEFLKDEIDVDYRDLSDDGDSFELSEKQALENIENFKKDVKDSQQDVHPLTCLVGLAAAGLAFKNGRKAIACARSAVAVVGGAVAKGATKVASKVVKSIDYNKASAKINNTVSALASKSEVNDPKLTQAFENAIDTVFSREVDGKMQEKGKAVVGVLNKFGVPLTKQGLVDAIGAGAIAYGAMDVTTDLTEGAQDKHKILESAKRNLGGQNPAGEFAADIFNILSA